jgi:DNA-binding NarL/FixJ family response regulator
MPHDRAGQRVRLLRSADLRSLANLIDSLMLVEPDEAPSRLVHAALDLVPGVMASYNEFSNAGTVVPAVHPGEVPPPAEVEAFTLFFRQHPVIAALGEVAAHRAATISDYCTPRRLRRLDLYQEVYRPRGILDQLTLSAEATDGSIVGLAISGSRWGFTDRDRLLIDLLAPYLGTRHARLEQVQRLRELHRALAEPEHADSHAVIVLTHRKQIAWLTRPARRLLRDWFGYSGGSVLPPALHQVGGPRTPTNSTTFFRGNRTLVVSTVSADAGGQSLLELTQTVDRGGASVAAATLTSRERQILAAAADGLSENAIAARFGIAPATVNKHLEHCYRKLGASNRARAITAAFGSRT